MRDKGQVTIEVVTSLAVILLVFFTATFLAIQKENQNSLLRDTAEKDEFCRAVTRLATTAHALGPETVLESTQTIRFNATLYRGGLVEVREAGGNSVYCPLPQNILKDDAADLTVQADKQILKASCTREGVTLGWA